MKRLSKRSWRDRLSFLVVALFSVQAPGAFIRCVAETGRTPELWVPAVCWFLQSVAAGVAWFFIYREESSNGRREREQLVKEVMGR
jgi:hypothetical protein